MTLSVRVWEYTSVSYRTGRKILWDAESETIRNDPEADKLLTRVYRELWVLPAP